MAQVFEYDVFLSFATADEKIVKPLWHELSVNGLRVFWSDVTLRKELGNSWSAVIESSLENSRHLLLICTPASLASTWVKREYRAFYDHCYKPPTRLLIPIFTPTCQVDTFPLFLKDLQAIPFSQLDLKALIPQLGGVNIENLKLENEALRRDNRVLADAKAFLEEELRRFSRPSDNETGIQDPKRKASEIVDGRDSTVVDQFALLGLSATATSQEILWHYETLKKEYESLSDNCSQGLRDVCHQRLQDLETAFSKLFSPTKRREEQKLHDAYETLQLQKTEASPRFIEKRYSELQAACQRAMESSDPMIKEVAIKESEKLKEAFLTIKPTAFVGNPNNLIQIVMPQMGESIAEGTITKWLKHEGEYVDRDEPLFEISTDKVDAEIPSPARGVLREILFQEGETVEVNTVVATLEDGALGGIAAADQSPHRIVKLTPR